MSEYEGKYPKDAFGTNIAIGAIVVYPSRRGSSMWMNRGTVQDFYCSLRNNKEWLLNVRGHSSARLGTGVPAGRCVVMA